MKKERRNSGLDESSGGYKGRKVLARDSLLYGREIKDEYVYRRSGGEVIH